MFLRVFYFFVNVYLTDTNLLHCCCFLITSISAAPSVPGFKGHLLDVEGNAYIYTCSSDAYSIDIGSSDVTCPVATFDNVTDTWSTFSASCTKGECLIAFLF